jgi:translin
MIPDLKRIEDKVARLESDRDRVFQLSKDLIRVAGKAIAFMHAYGPRKAKPMVLELGVLKARLSKSEKGFEYYAVQAHQEYTEALVLYHILLEKKVPSMGQVKEGEVAYLLGLMDVIGELKREAIESIRKGRNQDAKDYYRIMSDIYDSTLHMRFANSILPDFRRKQDVARIQIESVMNEMLHISRGLRGHT